MVALFLVVVGSYGNTFPYIPSKISIFIKEDVKEYCSKLDLLKIFYKKVVRLAINRELHTWR